MTVLSIPPRPVDAGVVAMLERLLDEAKRGELVGIAGVARMVNQEFSEFVKRQRQAAVHPVHRIHPSPPNANRGMRGDGMTDGELRTIVEPKLDSPMTFFTPWGVFRDGRPISACTPPNEHHWQGRGVLCVCGAMEWPLAARNPRPSGREIR